MLDDGLERGNDAVEQSGDVAGGEQDVVDAEKDLEAIAFAGELALVGLSGFEVDGVVDGDGGLCGDPLHEGDFGVGNAVGNVTAKAEGAEAMLRGGEGQNDDGADTGVAHVADKFGVAGFVEDIGRNERMLGAPDPAGGGGVHGQFLRPFDFGGVAGFENLETHGVADRVVENECEKIERQNGVKTLGKLVEETLKVALLGDGFGDVEEGFELAAGMLNRGDRRRDGGNRIGRIRHNRSRITLRLRGSQQREAMG